MYENSLYFLIVDYKNGDKNKFTDIVDKFNNIIRKYSRDSYYEDMDRELILFLLKLINNISLEKLKIANDKCISSYICTSLKNEYIRLNKKAQKKITLETSSVVLESISYTDEVSKNEISKIDVINSLDNLNLKEKQILMLRYLYGYSINEISNMYNVSRQSINTIKNKAILKLKDTWDIHI